MCRWQGAKWSFSLAWNIFSTFEMRKHSTRHRISICCSLAPRLLFCLYPHCASASFVSRAALNVPHTRVTSVDIHNTHTAATQSQKPRRKSAWSLLRSYSPCEQQMASPSPLPCAAVQRTSTGSGSKTCANPALSQLSWGFGTPQHWRELPGKLSLPVTLPWEIFTLFPSVMPVTPWVW